MVIDATERFARRVAKWMNESTLNSLEMSQRLGRFPDKFVKQVVIQSRVLKAERNRGR